MHNKAFKLMYVLNGSAIVISCPFANRCTFSYSRSYLHADTWYTIYVCSRLKRATLQRIRATKRILVITLVSRQNSSTKSRFSCVELNYFLFILLCNSRPLLPGWGDNEIRKLEQKLRSVWQQMHICVLHYICDWFPGSARIPGLYLHTRNHKICNFPGNDCPDGVEYR